MATRKRPTKPLIDLTLDDLPRLPDAGEFDPAYNAAITESLLRLQTRLSAPKCSGADRQKHARARNLLSLNATPTSSQILYHYSNGDAFWSIIEKGDIWLSDIFSLNDSTELKWGRDTFLKVFLEHPHLFDDDFRDFAIYMVFSMHEGMRQNQRLVRGKPAAGFQWAGPQGVVAASFSAAFMRRQIAAPASSPEFASSSARFPLSIGALSL